MIKCTSILSKIETILTKLLFKGVAHWLCRGYPPQLPARLAPENSADARSNRRRGEGCHKNTFMPGRWQPKRARVPLRRAFAPPRGRALYMGICPVARRREAEYQRCYGAFWRRVRIRRCALGRLTVTVVPLFGPLSTSIFPPCALTIACIIVIPRPCPSAFVV